ncbi:ParB N-terminal domain-containing protein [Heliobacterium chlorum]|uniref:ParB N-terminal domain-containing protein n=1 Tax=Heliobacterium chlorum TaxID=2698 RepID=A0ABR7T9P9_HELCL|nr:ParB N-terminal domain-containing protein [Heliobacterium chlorum]MBC9786641.1 ParB N-terminal domain-containing protein [Heliobacterium chlorum]
MSFTYRVIPLNQIDIEFERLDDDITTLCQDIENNGLTDPLCVEQISKNHYILVLGYRRLRCLKILGKDAECIVRPDSGKVNRIVHRIKADLQKKSYTPYEIKTMVTDLIKERLSLDEISKRTGLSKKTVVKYSKYKDVKAKEPGTEGGTSKGKNQKIKELHYMIESLPVSDGIKQWLVNMYDNKMFNRSHFKSIDKIVRNVKFIDADEEIQKEYIRKTIEHVDFVDKFQEEIFNQVNKQASKKVNSNDYDKYLNLKEKLGNILNSDEVAAFYNFESEQKKDIISIFLEIAKAIGLAYIKRITRFRRKHQAYSCKDDNNHITGYSPPTC